MKKFCLSAILATAATLIIRVTVYTDDCNLLVLTVTWLAMLVIFTGITSAIKRISGKQPIHNRNGANERRIGGDDEGVGGM